MSFIKTDIDRISILDEIDLHPVYNYGRALNFNNKTPVDYTDINHTYVEQALVNDITNFAQRLTGLLKNADVPFHPCFIELSLYDPKDRTGKMFYSVLVSNKLSIIQCYIQQIKKNIPNNKDSKRGPIIPNRLLHQSVYYSIKEEDMNNTIKFNEINDSEVIIYIGKFDITGQKIADTKKQLNEQIDSFLREVSETCMTEVCNAGGNFSYNSSILIPLFRPAALFKGEKESIFNGGGLFVYGNIESLEKESILVLELQTKITKSIFRASYAQIHFDEIDAFKNVFTSMLIHQIKNKITIKITQAIGHLLKHNQLDGEVKRTLVDIKSAAQNISKKFSNYLNNIGFALSSGDAPEIDFLAFERIVQKIETERGINIVLKNELNTKPSFLKANGEIIESIFDEIIENALNYYTENSIDPDLREIAINWLEDVPNNHIQIIVASKNTLMSEDVLRYYGLSPIKETGSTGLGGFFINQILEQIEAKRFQDGRYFKMENNDNGFSILINFNLYIQKDAN